MIERVIYSFCFSQVNMSSNEQKKKQNQYIYFKWNFCFVSSLIQILSAVFLNSVLKYFEIFVKYDISLCLLFELFTCRKV